MMALRAGARHVTAVDRWLYMALACKESLVRLSGFPRLLLIPHDLLCLSRHHSVLATYHRMRTR